MNLGISYVRLSFGSNPAIVFIKLVFFTIVNIIQHANIINSILTICFFITSF
nr:MAG TPA: hypothetical protein [Caudoviricetes sp.]